ncbi:MAG: hypothetical protein JW724_04520 [Candidatus Altiarchaeota archaeon]|nr:hypothetical protein [Candidatus Altiarchaeota archaeon]
MVKEIADIAFREVLGLPLIAYGGAFTLLCFTVTAVIGFLTFRGIKRFPVSWHTRLAYLSLVLGLFHGLIGLLAYI